jgi:hypothetical protein
MAKLLPPSNFSFQKSAIVKADKFLGAKTKTTNVNVKESTKESPKLLEDTLTKIERKVVQIDKLLKDSLFLTKKENEKKRKGEEQKEFEGREKELEKKKPKEVKGLNLPTPPKKGFLDWIRNFITQTVLGFIAVRLIDHLPKLLSLLPTIIKVTDFITDVGGKMLDGLITFIDWGYKAFDATRGFIKNIGGEGLAQTLDKFGGALNGLLDAAIVVGLASLAMGGDEGAPGGGRRGFDTQGRRVGKDVQRRYAQRYGKEQFLDRFGRKNLRNLSGGMQRNAFQKGARSVFMGLAGKQGAKTVLKFVKPLVSRIPIIGGLIEFGLSWALGEPVGKAAFRGIGSVLVGAIGTAIGGPVGAFLGSWAGGEAGGILYDMFFGNKKVKPQGKVAKAAGGGRPATRGGKLVSGPARRTISKKKKPRTLKATPSKLKPGALVGGEKNIKKLYPESKDKTKMSPFDFLKKSYETFSRATGFGSLIALAIKPLMGDKPSYADYKNAGVGINNWMNQSVSPTTLAYAGGGEVTMESIVTGEDYSNVIAKSLQDSVAPEVDKTIQDLMKQLMLKQPSKEPDKSDPTKNLEEETPPGGLTEGQWGPLLDLIAGKESGGNYEAMYPSTTLKGATKMTIAEVARRATGAVGKYQQLPQYLVGRAKAAGLNPDKDLYSPENQEKIIINVNIKGRGGERWLKGEISDEQFMQGLSQEFASLPNAQGQFYYPGQRSAMTPEKVKAALSKVKKGGYSQTELAAGMGRGPAGFNVGKLGGSVVEYITGDPNTTFGKFDRAGHGTTSNYHDHIAFKDRDTAIKAYKFFQSKGIQVTEFKGYGPVGGHAPGSYHYDGLAFDIPGAQWGGSGSIGPKDYAGSAKVRTVLKQFLGGGSTEIASKFHGGSGFVSKDGFMLKLHKGEMYKVIDKDSVDLLGIDFAREIIEIENRAQLVAKAPSIIEKLKSIAGYTDYEMPYGGEPQIIEVPVEIPVPVPMGGRGSTIVAGGGVNNSNDMFDQTLAQV